MNAYELALKIEDEGRDYYFRQAEKTDDTQLKQLFTMLADDEKRHAEIIRDMQQKDFEYKGTQTFQNTRRIFKERSDGKRPFEVEITRLEAYQHAIELEEKSIELYADLESKASGEKEREVLHKLKKEEQKHTAILDNLIEFIRRPETWVESPEFTHLEEY